MKKYEELPVQAKAAIWFVICSILQKGISVITTPIFTRLMSTAEYGRFNVFISWEGIITAIVVLSLPWGVIPQGLVKYEEDRDAFSSTSFGLMTVLVIIWGLIYLAFHTFFNQLLNMTTPIMINMFIMIWSSSTYNFWTLRQRVEYRYKKLVIITVGTSILIPIVSFFLIFMLDDSVMARIVGISVTQFSVYVFLGFNILIKGKKIYSEQVWKYDIKFNIPLLPHYLSQRVLTSSDRIMIESMISSSAAGIYSLSYSLGFLVQTISAAISDAIGPWQYKKIKEKDYDKLAKMAYGLLVGMASLILLFICFAPEFVRIFAPPDYYEAAYLIPPISISVYYIFMYGIFADFEFYFEKTKMISVATLFAAIINIGLNFICINLFGYAAASYTTLACYIMYAIFHYKVMARICKEELGGVKIYDSKILFFISFVFTIFGLLLMFVYSILFIRITVVIIIMAVGYIKRDKIREAVKLFKLSRSDK